MDERGYQHGFSKMMPGMYDETTRKRKAHTVTTVLQDHLGSRLSDARLLDVGASTGIIDAYMAHSVADVVGIDIDRDAIEHATRNYPRANLRFLQGDAMRLAFADNAFDVVLCMHVYEHVPSAELVMAEIYRVLKPGGVCYFSAGNVVQWKEPHYNIHLLSLWPKPIADWWLRRKGIADGYYEQHRTLRSLRRLADKFVCHDYTRRLISEANHYGTDYMINPQSTKGRLALRLVDHLYGLCPTYIWLLEKPL